MELGTGEREWVRKLGNHFRPPLSSYSSMSLTVCPGRRDLAVMAVVESKGIETGMEWGRGWDESQLGMDIGVEWLLVVD